MMTISREVIDRKAAEELAKIQTVLWDFEFAECMQHVAARDYDAVTTLLRDKLDQEARDFVGWVTFHDDFCWFAWSFRRKVRQARKRYEAVTKAYGSWGVFITRVEYDSWGD